MKSSLGNYRATKQKLHKGKQRGNSSSAWLERQLNDPYVQLAKAQGYRSRAAFKLIEINDKYKIIKSGMKVIDLGAAPGGWSQVAANIVFSKNRNDGAVVAMDLLDIKSIPNVTFIQGDFLQEEIQQQVIEKINGKADAIISDMAANTSGHRSTDQIRSVALVEEAVYFAENMLDTGGSLLCKIFNSSLHQEVIARVRTKFSSINTIKPQASRSDSKEIYLLFRGFHYS